VILRSRAALAAIVLSLVTTSCGPATSARKPDDEKTWRATLPQLMPGDLDVVVRADWARARREQLDEALIALLHAGGLSTSVTDTLTGCLARASELRLGVRLGPTGLDGDAIVVLSGLGAVGEAGPCGAKGWKRTGERAGLTVYEPLTPAFERTAAAMLLRSEAGDLALVTPGQLDALLRLLRDGPDTESLASAGDALLTIETRANEAMLPERWRAQAPAMAAITRGLVRGTLRVNGGDPLRVRAMLTYTDAAAATAAGERVKAVRDAMRRSERAELRSAAESAHATLQDDVLQVVLEVRKVRFEGE
jgi:hypothetical protein